MWKDIYRQVQYIDSFRDYLVDRDFPIEIRTDGDFEYTGPVWLRDIRDSCRGLPVPVLWGRMDPVLERLRNESTKRALLVLLATAPTEVEYYGIIEEFVEGQISMPSADSTR